MDTGSDYVEIDMSFFGKLLQSTIDVVVTPIELARDVMTLGGVVTGEHEPYTVQRIRQLAHHLEEAYDELDKP